MCVWVGKGAERFRESPYFWVLKHECDCMKVRNQAPGWGLTFHVVWGKDNLMFSSELCVVRWLVRTLPNILPLCLISQESTLMMSMCYYAQPYIGSGYSNLGPLLCSKHFTYCVIRESRVLSLWCCGWTNSFTFNFLLYSFLWNVSEVAYFLTFIKAKTHFTSSKILLLFDKI